MPRALVARVSWIGTARASLGREGPESTAHPCPDSCLPSARVSLLAIAFFLFPDLGHPCVADDGRAVSHQLVLTRRQWSVGPSPRGPVHHQPCGVRALTWCVAPPRLQHPDMLTTTSCAGALGQLHPLTAFLPGSHGLSVPRVACLECYPGSLVLRGPSLGETSATASCLCDSREGGVWDGTWDLPRAPLWLL